MAIRIEQINTVREIKKFVKFPWSIYKKNPYWVPPLIGDQIKFLRKDTGIFYTVGDAQLFMAFDGNTPVGRISAHINYSYEKHHDNETGFFGFFECVDDKNVAQALLNAAESWVLSKNKSRIVGPMSFTVYDELGIVCKGFDSIPFVMTAYNLHYYNDLVMSAGYRKEVDWYAFIVDENVKLRPSLFKIRDRVKRQKDLIIKTVDMKNLDQAVDDIGPVFEEAWNENWGHVPLTSEQLDYFKEELKHVIIPEITYLAYIDGECVGFSLSIKDANPALQKVNGKLWPFGLFILLWEIRKVHRCRTLLMGVLKKYRHRAIDLVFYLDTIEKGTAIGYSESECSVILENNHRMIRALDDLQARNYKTLRIYNKKIK
ncbi:hypothetical protein JW935_24175 [candidate division KSB1 bacterium]|nr:hypothetical protein [candidate division KSB1 bacterium]